jgi:hypothetical protein
MIAALAKGLEGFFDRRWLVSFYFPGLLFSALIFLVVTFPDDPARIITAYRQWPDPIQAIGVLCFLAASVVLGSFLSIAAAAALRILEGRYLPAFVTQNRINLYRDRINAKRARYATLAEGDPDRNELATALYDFPSPRLAMPTKLGNLLAAAERYPGDRYGADSVLLWPHLLAVVPADTLERIRAARAALDLWVVLWGLSLAFSLFAGPWLASSGAGGWPVSLALLGIPLSVLFYGGAVSAAREFGLLVRSAFDLHRWAILEAFKIELPQSEAEERELWGKVSQKIAFTSPGGITYSTKKEKPAPTPPAPPLGLGAFVHRVITILLGTHAPAPNPPQTPSLPIPPTPSAPAATAPAAPTKKGRDWTPAYGLLALAACAGLVWWAQTNRVSETSIIPPRGFTQFALKSSPELTFGGKLQPGETVTIMSVPKTGNPVTFKNVRILSVPLSDSAPLIVGLPQSDAERLAAASGPESTLRLLRPAP